MDNAQKARDFIKMAQADYISAQCSSVPYSICFHAQQCAEKYIKAFLAFHGVPIKKTHDISELLGECIKIAPAFSALFSSAESLKPFGVNIRYEASKYEADTRCHEVWLAHERISEVVRRELPSHILVYE
ncbi:HEPN domain-containing protein [Methyloglobulus sp.]|uniref:HEPN domain-containing protein n=1 Tax=Methyloglobulus sp. TaxID=2518622 RepID=UPI003989CEEC